MEPKIEIHWRAIEARKKSIADWKISTEDKKALVRFLDGLALGQVNRGRMISESRQCKYLDVLRVPLEFFKKPASRLTVKEIEKLERAINSETLRSARGGPYAHATRVDMRRALRVYLRWKLGRGKADKLTDWLDLRQVFKTPDYLKEEEVSRLFHACKTAHGRFLIAMLFDTGVRATELHNIRFEDVELARAKDIYPKVTLRQEYSKTLGRTISLYWEHSKLAVEEFVARRIRKGIRTGEPLFNSCYAAGRLLLRRLGKQVLGRSVHYQSLRK